MFTAVTLQGAVNQHKALAAQIEVGEALLRKLAAGSTDLTPDEVRATQEAMRGFEMMRSTVPGMFKPEAAAAMDTLRPKLDEAAKAVAH